jgi:hypothetical protein
LVKKLKEHEKKRIYKELSARKEHAEAAHRSHHILYLFMCCNCGENSPEVDFDATYERQLGYMPHTNHLGNQQARLGSNHHC